MKVQKKFGKEKKRGVALSKSSVQPRENSIVAEAEASYAYREKDKVIDFMGLKGKKYGIDLNAENYFIEVIRMGVPKKVIDQLMVRIGLDENEMAAILHVSKRTLQRREPTELLNEEQSERIIELAKLYSKGEEVLGDIESFKEWMNHKVLALGNKRPKEFLDTSIGIRLLLDELGRIQHGVYS